MNIGITFLFKTKQNYPLEGVLISCVMVFDNEKEDLLSTINTRSKQIGEYLNYIYIGVNDVFYVTGLPKENEIIGRTTHYDFKTVNKSKLLIQTKKNILKELNNSDFHEKFCFSSIYFCENESGEGFTLSIKSIVNTNSIDAFEKVLSTSNKKYFKDKIKSFSVEEINTITFIGIEYIEPINYELNIFEILYGDFENRNSLEEEVITNDNLIDQFNDIVYPIARK